MILQIFSINNYTSIKELSQRNLVFLDKKRPINGLFSFCYFNALVELRAAEPLHLVGANHPLQPAC